MSAPAVMTDEPKSVQMPAVPVPPLHNPAMDDFDRALEQLAGSLMAGPVKPFRTRAADQEETPEASPASSFSAMVGTAAIAAAGYRFVLRPPDDPKLRPWWYARFPAI